MGQKKMSGERFELSYLDTAKELTLLLIHGFPFNSGMWWSQLNALENQARVIAPDLRGFGQSPPVNETEMSIASYAQDCANLLDSLGIQYPVVVCGLSMGGYIALEFCHLFPERVLGLLLTATRAAADSEEVKARRNDGVITIRRQGVEVYNKGLLPKLFAPQTLKENNSLVQNVKGMMDSSSRAGMITALLAMRDRPDYRPILNAISVPTMIIHGNDDQIVPLAEAQEMQQQIRHARLLALPNAGHLPNLEKPHLWNGLAADFLEQFE